MKDLQTYWIVHRAMRASGWTDETVQSSLAGGSMLEVTPDREEPFYCLGTYNAAKLMGITESTGKNARDGGTP